MAVDGDATRLFVHTSLVVIPLVAEAQCYMGIPAMGREVKGKFGCQVVCADAIGGLGRITLVTGSLIQQAQTETDAFFPTKQVSVVALPGQSCPPSGGFRSDPGSVACVMGQSGVEGQEGMRLTGPCGSGNIQQAQDDSGCETF